MEINHTYICNIYMLENSYIIKNKIFYGRKTHINGLLQDGTSYLFFTKGFFFIFTKIFSIKS